MQIKVYAVEFQLSASAKRAIRFVFLPIVVLLGTIAVAHATYDTSWIASGQVIDASKLKQNLDEAQSRIAALESTVAAMQNPPQPSIVFKQLANGFHGYDTADETCPAGYRIAGGSASVSTPFNAVTSPPGTYGNAYVDCNNVNGCLAICMRTVLP
jgi:hypothetical protein